MMKMKKISALMLISGCLLVTNQIRPLDKKTMKSLTNCMKCGCNKPPAPAPQPQPIPQPAPEEVTKGCPCNRPSAPAPQPQPQPAPEAQDVLKGLMKLYCKAMLKTLAQMDKCACNKPPAPAPQPVPQPAPEEATKGCPCNRPSAPAPQPQPQPTPEAQQPQDAIRSLMKLYCRVMLEKTLADMDNAPENMNAMEKMVMRAARPEGEPFIVEPCYCN
jgi:hypothetical protein